MRKIFVSNLVSVDGYFEDANKGLDWFVINDEFVNYSRSMLKGTGLILFGRKTYQLMAAYWPNAEGDDPVVREGMNNLPKIVFSKTLSNVEWNNCILAKDIVAEEIIKLKEQPGKDIAILGSGEIVSSLTQLGLIDEYRLIVDPVILGSGNPLFKGIHNRVKLQLVKTETFNSGIVILHYRPVKK